MTRRKPKLTLVDTTYELERAGLVKVEHWSDGSRREWPAEITENLEVPDAT